MKKILPLLISAAMAVSMLSGCGNDNKTGPGTVPENNMRDISSMELVKDMGIGWNLGDTLDVCQADRNGDGKINIFDVTYMQRMLSEKYTPTK